MSDIWLTSDTHGYHKRIMEFCRNTRRGEDEVEMTELMIEAWNSVVRRGDRIYHMGDFCFGGREKIKSFKSRLNGDIHLIKGNHDYQLVGTKEIAEMFTSIREYRSIKLNSQMFCMSHFPMARFENMGHGSIMAHGHCHGGFTSEFKIIDVGIDARPDNKMLPWHVEEVIEMVKDRRVIDHHDN